jgi:hypothetical protein
MITHPDGYEVRRGKDGNMFRISRVAATCLVSLGVVSSLACTSPNVTAPDVTAPGVIVSSASTAIQTMAVGTHGHPLTAIVGNGTGLVNISPDASQEGFSTQLVVSVHGTAPNANFLLTRSVDLEPDGVCTGTVFTPLPLPNPGPLVMLRTSPAGAGAQHASFAFTPPPPAPFEDGKQFDLHWEIRTEDSTTVLRSDCITVTVK